MPVKTRIIKIGNSQGIRIPKPLLDQAGLSGEVELDVRDKQIVIQERNQVRSGWDAAFKSMADEGDDQVLGEEGPSEWDKTEWEWE